jgi:adenosylmethionine-8-amino-7-oxononanoate aminotransferase
MLRNELFNTEEVQAEDNLVVHPWEDFKTDGKNKRTIIGESDGIYVYDTDGNKLIDAPSGMWCVNIGHGRREMADAIAEQVMRMPYYSPWSLGTAPAAELGKKLADLAPGDLDHVAFSTGGSTAVETALRFVMFYNNILERPEKKHIISRQDAYHGSTYLAASCSGKGRDKPLQDFETARVHHLPSPNPYRRPEGMSVEDFCAAKVKDLEDKILELGADKTAAFIAEPILASGGVIVPPPGYHQKCLEVCRKHDVLYISDEVVTAFGRLGHFFASEEVFGIVPDIITTAKGLTSGHPHGRHLDLRPPGAATGRPGRQDRHVLPRLHLFRPSGGRGSGPEEHRDHRARGDPGACPQGRALFPEPPAGAARHPAGGRRARRRPDGLCRMRRTMDYEIGNRIDKHCQELGLIVRPIINMCVMSPPLIITKPQIDDLVGMLRQGIQRTMDDMIAEGLWEA